MKWYGADALFAYARFSDRTELGHSDFYSCNLSLKAEFLRTNGTFDEEFKTAAYEDIELGYRLEKAGMRLLYNPQAMAYHHQYISFEDACRRAKKTAVAAEVFKRKEAGKHLGRTSSLKRYIKRGLALPLAPLKCLMDSTLPLPWMVYRTMFRVYQ
jgi:GT2 family glycosyltransferase